MQKNISMQTLGYIVSKRKIRNVVGFVKVVDSIESIDDKTKPTLVIGLEEAKKTTDNFSILEKKINDNLYWTFAKTERRTDYDRDLELFCGEVLKRSIDNIKYVYVNILNLGYQRLKKLILFLQSNVDKHIYICNDMVYVYSGQKVFGVSLRLLRYNKIVSNKVIKWLYKQNKNKLYFNDKCLSFKLRQVISNKKYATPYFLSIFECEQ